MKIKHLLTKTLLVAAGLLVGTSVTWATIDLPSGYEITKAYIGTLSAGVVTPENFNNYSIGSSWSIVKAGSTSIESTLTITDVTEVVKPAVNGSVETGVIPTYVSGKSLTGTIPSTTNTWIQHRFTYDLGETLTDGYLVFSGDFYNAGANKVTPERFYLLDEEDNVLVMLFFKGGSNQQLFQITENGVTRNWNGVQSESRSDTGFGIKDLTINIAAGTATFTLDYIHKSSGGRNRKTASTTLNFGTGHNIRKIAFGREEYNSNPELTYLDNVELYRLEPSTSSHTWTIKANCGGTLVQIATGQAEEGNTYSFSALPKVVSSNSKYYYLDDASVTGYSTETYTMGSIDETREISYTLDESIVFFLEGETLDQSTASSDCSGGAYSNYYAGPYSISITDAGTYNLETYVASRNTNSSLEVYTNYSNVSVAQIEKGGALGERSCSFVAPAASTMRVGGPYYSDKFQNSLGFDYILIRKTSTGSTLSKDITSAGWATYCSPYALDFSSAIANLEDAYIVTGGAAGVLTKTPVTGGTVPANTGLLLKGSAGTVNIPVAASSSTDVSANKLIGVTANTPIAAEAGYVLMASPSLGFYKNNNDFTVGAYTAYLPVDFAGAGAPSFFSLDFDGETTGIADVRGKMEDVRSDFFDLQGRKVAQPAKGLYIVNGKKVVIK